MSRRHDYTAIAADYKSGLNTIELQEKYGIHASSILRTLRKMGVQMRTRSEATKGRPSPTRGKALLSMRTFNHNAAIDLYKSGLSLNEVGRRVGAPAELVRKTLERNGVPRRPRGSRKGENNHPCLGGARINHIGYVVRRAERCGGRRGLEHRLIVEDVIGRPLKRTEDIHHIDGNRANNANSNLLVCTHKYHMWLHAELRRVYGDDWRDHFTN